MTSLTAGSCHCVKVCPWMFIAASRSRMVIAVFFISTKKSYSEEILSGENYVQALILLNNFDRSAPEILCHTLKMAPGTDAMARSGKCV